MFYFSRLEAENFDLDTFISKNISFKIIFLFEDKRLNHSAKINPKNIPQKDFIQVLF